ncbi:MAG: DUF108 domain-containing protein [Xanthobacteraceae bacterium]|nr:DUF108 domain-containing protein [Xanthobacteraceae bacterium]
MARIGIIGFGYVGAGLHKTITSGECAGLEVAFAWNRSKDKLAGIDPRLVLERLDDFAATAPDLIVEAAHPQVSVTHGAAFLERCDYMPLSVTALADDSVHERLVSAAERTHHHLILPHGALVGTDALLAWRHMWRDVTITFRKHPLNIDLAAVKRRPQDITTETVIFDGSVREIAPLFPRNVNTMVTCALATVGLDKCRGRMIADPALECAVAEIEAWGKDGSYLTTVKRQPMVGVSGTEMFASTLRSVLKATGTGPTVDFL